MDFKVGDTVEVGLKLNKITGVVTRINIEKQSGKTLIVEIQRPGGSHNEFLPDPDTGFDFISKVEV